MSDIAPQQGYAPYVNGTSALAREQVSGENLRSRRFWEDLRRQFKEPTRLRGASPSAAIALMRMNREIDISGILHTVQVPALVLHLTDDTLVSVEGGRELAAGIPKARLVEFPGTDHLAFLHDTDRILAEIAEFSTGSRSTPIVDRVLATVVFTDIVDSTVRASVKGDLAWRDLLNAHDKAVRQELSRFRGREVKSLGDGFLATFDRPARAIHCARAIRDSLHRLALPVRIGVHTGEVNWQRTMYAGSPCTSPRVWRISAAPTTCSSRAP